MESMEFDKTLDKSLELTYSNINVLIESVEKGNEFFAVVIERKNKLYIKPLDYKMFFYAKVLYEVDFEGYCFNDLKDKDYKWYEDKYSAFLSKATHNTIVHIEGLVLHSFWDKKSECSKLNLGILTQDKNVALKVKNEYNQKLYNLILVRE